MEKTIFQKIPKVMADLGAVAKGGVNGQQNYRFRKVDDIYNKLQPALFKNGVFIIPQVLESHEQTFESAKGTRQMRVKLKVKYVIYADDGSFVEAIAEGESIDSSDKATNKAFTAAFKYMLIQAFCIAVEEVEDADEHSPEIPQDKKAPLKADPTDVKKLLLGLEKLNVHESQVFNRYSIKTAKELTQDMYQELIEIGTSLKNKSDVWQSYFNPRNHANGAQK